MKLLNVGGLFVRTERSETRRIDDQLRGRMLKMGNHNFTFL